MRILSASDSHFCAISIHALREEGDRSWFLCRKLTAEISIHALREEGDPVQRFLKTVNILISIHALREEGDRFG